MAFFYSLVMPRDEHLMLISESLTIFYDKVLWKQEHRKDL